MNILEISVDILGAEIVSRLDHRDRFLRFALVCKQFSELAYSSPLPNFKFYKSFCVQDLLDGIQKELGETQFEVDILPAIDDDVEELLSFEPLDRLRSLFPTVKFLDFNLDYTHIISIPIFIRLISHFENIEGFKVGKVTTSLRGRDDSALFVEFSLLEARLFRDPMLKNLIDFKNLTYADFGESQSLVDVNFEKLKTLGIGVEKFDVNLSDFLAKAVNVESFLLNACEEMFLFQNYFKKLKRLSLTLERFETIPIAEIEELSPGLEELSITMSPQPRVGCTYDLPDLSKFSDTLWKFELDISEDAFLEEKKDPETTMIFRNLKNLRHLVLHGTSSLFLDLFELSTVEFLSIDVSALEQYHFMHFCKLGSLRSLKLIRQNKFLLQPFVYRNFDKLEYFGIDFQYQKGEKALSSDERLMEMLSLIPVENRLSGLDILNVDFEISKDLLSFIDEKFHDLQRLSVGSSIWNQNKVRRHHVVLTSSFSRDLIIGECRDEFFDLHPDDLAEILERFPTLSKIPLELLSNNSQLLIEFTERI